MQPVIVGRLVINRCGELILSLARNKKLSCGNKSLLVSFEGKVTKMKITPFLFLALAPGLLLAQQANQSKLTAGLFTENQYFSPAANLEKIGVGLFARYGQRESSQWRFQLLFSQQAVAGGIAKIQQMADTDIHVRFDHIQYQGALGVGREVSRAFYKKIRLLAAVDARLGYARGRYEKLNDYVRYDTLNMTYTTFRFTKESVPGMYSSVVSLQTLPSIGVRLPLRKIAITAESGLMMSMSYGRYQGLTSRSMHSDIHVTGLIHRLIITYAF